MIEGLKALNLIIGLGRNLIDILFEKKITRREIEAMIDKCQCNQQKMRDTFFVVINNNQELVFNEKGELFIKTKDVDKELFKQTFLQMLKDQYEVLELQQWKNLPKTEVLEEVCSQGRDENLSSHVETIQELIDKTKRKHEILYGESY